MSAEIEESGPGLAQRVAALEATVDRLLHPVVNAEAAQEWHADLLEMAWGVIANAGWDDMAKTEGWQDAAVRWRDSYHRWLDQHSSPAGYQTWEQLARSLRCERDALFAETQELRRALRTAVPGDGMAVAEAR